VDFALEPVSGIGDVRRRSALLRMGNQLPTKCVAACNPACCANCINPQTGRLEEGDTSGGAGSSQKAAGVFANAASVLSAASEEIALDDHLEKELANEVELWRLETTSVVSQHRQMYDLQGLSGAMRGDADTEIPFHRERSPSPELRTQVSLHNRIGLDPQPKPVSDPRKEEVVEGPGSRMQASKEFTSASSSGLIESTRESTAQPEDSFNDQLGTSSGAGALPSPVGDVVDITHSDLDRVAADPPPVPLPSQMPNCEDEVSSEDSTFAGFIEDTLERDAAFSHGEGEEYRIWLGQDKRIQGVPESARRGHLVQESPSFNGSEVSGVIPDRSRHF